MVRPGVGRSIAEWRPPSARPRERARCSWRLSWSTPFAARRRAAEGVDQLSRQEQRARTRGLALGGRHSAMLLPTPGRTIAYPSPLWSDEANVEITRLHDLLVDRYGAAR